MRCASSTVCRPGSSAPARDRQRARSRRRALPPSSAGGSPTPRWWLAIVGVLADKDAAGVVQPLLPEVDTWIATSLVGARGATAAELKQRVGAPAAGWHEAASVTHACELALRLAAAADRIVVFGSFHTVGPAMEWLARAAASSAILARPQFG